MQTLLLDLHDKHIIIDRCKQDFKRLALMRIEVKKYIKSIKELDSISILII